MKEKKLWRLISVISVFTLVFMACSGYDYEGLDTVENAEAPSIKEQPQGGIYRPGEAIAPLKVTVNPLKDKGVLSYQWYYTTSSSSSGTML